MKKGYFVLFTVILLFTTLYAGAFLVSFRGYGVGDSIKIEWETGEETNLSLFIIERKTSESNWVNIAEIQPKGDNSYYSYIDEAIFKQNEYVFYYRLKIVESNGSISSTSNEITVSLNPSSVKKTWGSIKAMFR